MKITFIFSNIVFCFFLFSSCTHNDVPNAELLQGKWLYEGFTTNGLHEEEEEGDEIYDFKADGVIVMYFEGDSETGTYQVTENNITMRINGDSEAYEITKLTNSELNLFGMEDVDGDGEDEEVTYHFSKIDDHTPTNDVGLLTKLKGKWLLEGTTFEGEYQEWPIETGDNFFDFRTGGVLILIEEDGSEYGTYQLVGNDLTIHLNGVTFTHEITKLTNSELNLFTIEEVDEEIGLDELTYHFSKN